MHTCKSAKKKLNKFIKITLNTIKKTKDFLNKVWAIFQFLIVLSFADSCGGSIIFGLYFTGENGGVKIKKSEKKKNINLNIGTI